MGVAQLADQARFLVESFHQVLGVRDAVVVLVVTVVVGREQELDGDVAAEILLDRPVHPREASGADQIDDSVSILEHLVVRGEVDHFFEDASLGRLPGGGLVRLCVMWERTFAKFYHRPIRIPTARGADGADGGNDCAEPPR